MPEKPFRFPILKAIAFLGGLLLLFSVVLRVRRERADRAVHICLDWNDTAALLEKDSFGKDDAQKISLPAFLERCEIIGVSSVALAEEPLEGLAASGRLLFFSQAEVEKFKALGAASEDILKANLIWIRKDAALAQRVALALNAVYGFTEDSDKKFEIRKTGGYFLVENPVSSWSQALHYNAGPDPDQVKTLSAVGLKRVRLVADAGRKSGSEGNVTLDPDGEEPSAWIVALPSAELQKRLWMDRPGLIRAVAKSGSSLALFENQPRAFGGALADFPGGAGRIVRSHTVALEEMKGMSRAALKSRWIRAVRERSCRILYFRWNPDWSLEENLNLLREVSQGLKSRGFAMRSVTVGAPASCCASGSQEKGCGHGPLKSLRLFAAFLAAVLGPLAALWILRASWDGRPAGLRGVFASWAKALGVAVIAGLLIGALLPDRIFINGLEVFRGVKLALLLPLAFSGMILFGVRRLREAGKSKVSLLGLAGLGAVFLAVFLALDRSGNGGSTPHSLELGLRASLESILGVRPRFKEFLIGHPLMLLGVYLWGRRGEPSGGKEPLEAPLLCVWGGVIGWISVVNSFCHLHTPLAVTLLRTFHGAWLGALMGLLWIWLYRITHDRG